MNWMPFVLLVAGCAYWFIRELPRRNRTYRLLELLRGAQEPQTMSVLAASLQMSREQLTPILLSLRREGLADPQENSSNPLAEPVWAITDLGLSRLDRRERGLAGIIKDLPTRNSD